MKHNLIDYRVTSRSFGWQKATQFLPWLTPKINIGEIAIDSWTDSGHPDKKALIWTGDKGKIRTYTFLELKRLSNQFAYFLEEKGVRPFDRVFFFLPRLPELYYGFIGALKLGTTTGTFFAAFGGPAVTERLNKAQARVLITNKELFERIRPFVAKLKKVIFIILDEDFEKSLVKYPFVFNPREMRPEDPALMMFTSATGRTPVCGIVLPQSAIIQQTLTAKWVLDLQPEDIYWCTGDPGWITGVAYGILAPWTGGVTQVVYSGRYDSQKWLATLKKFRVSVLYTAPTALRMLQAELPLNFKPSFENLRLIASVGEPLTKASIKWGQNFFGLTIQDTWWQTETGAMMIANFPCLPVKPGSMGKPIPGIVAQILSDKGQVKKPGITGHLAFKPPWPSMMKAIWRRPARYASYFKKGFYFSGDLAYRDKEGYFWFVGRADDVIKTSGERVGPFEVESALAFHPAVAEAAVIGKPDPLRGQIIKAFVVLRHGTQPTVSLKQEIQLLVKKELAGHAYPREIEFVNSLPKTRSGKILRRLLRAKELGLPTGDLSSLEQPSGTEI